MPKSPARFTQAEVTRLLKGAEGTGFTFVSIEVLPTGLKATYSTEAPDHGQSSTLQAWKDKRDLGRQRLDARRIAQAAGKPNPALPFDEEWEASVRASALSGREKMALEALFHRRGQDVPHNAIKGAGISTQEALQVRGYAKIKMEGDRFLSWRLTEEGEAFCREALGLPAPPETREH